MTGSENANSGDRMTRNYLTGRGLDRHLRRTMATGVFVYACLLLVAVAIVVWAEVRAQGPSVVWRRVAWTALADVFLWWWWGQLASYPDPPEAG